MSGDTPWQLASAVIGVIGGLVVLIAMIGVLRLPDVFCRAHALGKGLTLGLGLVMLSLWMQMGMANAGLKVVAAILFQFITLPVASHLLARLSLEKDIWRAGRAEIDEDPRVRS
jgi:multicomponent Na+:H+ antiporter subunit G